MVETNKTKIKKSKKSTYNKAGIMWIAILLSIIAVLLFVIVYMIGKQNNTNIVKQQQETEARKQAKEDKLKKDLELKSKDGKDSNDSATISKKRDMEDARQDTGGISNEGEAEEQNTDNIPNEKEQEVTNTTKEKIVLSADTLEWKDKFIKTTLPKNYYVNYYLADITRGIFNGGTLNKMVIQEMGSPSVIYIEFNDEIHFLPERSNFSKEAYVDAFNKGKTFFVEIGASITELNYDDEISLKYNEMNAYAVKYTSPFGGNAMISFEEKNLKKIDYVHPKYGQAWITNDNNKDNESIFALNGIYFRGPANTTYIYKLIPDVVAAKPRMVDAYVGDVLDIVWDNGKKNTDAYTYGNNGCGISDFIAGTRNKYYDDVTNADLERIGKTATERIVYKLKSANHPIIKENFDKYNEIKEATWIKDKIKNKISKETVDTIEEFYEMNSIIVFYDAFERKHVMLLSLFEEPAECGKPVIYLYPEKAMNVNVKVAPTGGFTKVDPIYPEGGWNVKAYPSGQLFNYGDNESYPYLFWEGISDAWYNQPKKGFVVSRDEIGQLFDETLSAQNLNKQEILDFKEFWVPKILESSKPYFFITYTTEDFINRAAPLQVTPKPDTVIRVMMDYEPLDAKIQVEEMTFNPKERKGFTVIEWGGMLGK